MAGGIFISYRRDDAKHAAGRLVDRLGQTFSREQLFLDIDNIAPGLDFVKVLSEQVQACDVLLAVIGPGWLDSRDGNGARRLDNPKDFVRIEIEAALARNILVIPVLVDGAKMPGEPELPGSLQSLSNRNAVQLVHERFGADAEVLTRALAKVVVPKKKGGWFGGRGVPQDKPEWGQSLTSGLANAKPTQSGPSGGSTIDPKIGAPGQASANVKVVSSPVLVFAASGAVSAVSALAFGGMLPRLELYVSVWPAVFFALALAVAATLTVGANWRQYLAIVAGVQIGWQSATLLGSQVGNFFKSSLGFSESVSWLPAGLVARSVGAGRAGPGCLNRFSALISGTSAGFMLPSGLATG